MISGILTLDPKQVQSNTFREFERAWYSQPSTASMSEDGTRTDCSDAVDATGRYIWREDGTEQGRCCGIDFEKAGHKWSAKKCSNGNPVCTSAAISLYVPFAYDAAIALAHGLDDLVQRQGLRSDAITADRLLRAIKQKKSSFESVSGHVSFEDNGDRRTDRFEYAVYNYHETSRRFEVVGQLKNGSFTSDCDDGPCHPLIFSDGSSIIPAVRD